MGVGLGRGIHLWVTLVILSLAVYPTNGLPNPKERMGKGTDPPEVQSEPTWDQVSKSRVRVDCHTLQGGGDCKHNSGFQINKTNNPMAMSRKRRELNNLPLIPTCKECNKTVWTGGKRESTFVGYLQVNQLCYDKKKLEMCTLNGKTYWVGQNKKLQTASLNEGPILLDLLSDKDEREEPGIACELLESDFLKCSVGFPFMRSKSRYEFSVIFDTSHLTGQEETLTFLVTAQSENLERTECLHDNTLILSVPLMHEVDSSISGEVFPTSFFYGDSVEASNFVQLENHECLFQSLNFTLQIYNAGPSTLPGAFLDISIPNRLSAAGAEIFHIQQMMVRPGLGLYDSWISDCERRDISCLIVHCNLSSLPKAESLDINIYMLLNTEILKKDSSSVIQFVTRARLQVDHDLRVVEVPNGSPEEKSAHPVLFIDQRLLYCIHLDSSSFCTVVHGLPMRLFIDSAP
ncbi:hypothetical protein DUI87_18748 [Hirundo rustica rustica]|uniref:Uncharacterized protein n=1 Tax=Hirundo rustica rustica TaxID=333673 RepID=A0A3M0JWX4_HIRRU|nr:hypothetical protein DUI87_18748 [Hirundo rustica rustica]